MRLVLDTNVVISALVWNGPPRRILTSVYGNQATLFTSAPMFEELRRTLSRPKFDKRIYEARQSVGQLLGAYTQWATLVVPVPVPRIVSDAADDVVIGTAIADKADLVVTGDHALLSVVEYQSARIVSVVEALRTWPPLKSHQCLIFPASAHSSAASTPRPLAIPSPAAPHPQSPAAERFSLGLEIKP
jgi:uncharacterized protein